MRKRDLFRFTPATLLRGVGTSVVALCLMAGSAYAVTTLSANLATNGTLDVDGATTLDGTVSIGDALADLITVVGTLQGGLSPFTFEGAVADGFETVFALTEPAADRTITFQDVTGTVALLSDIEAADILTALLTVDTDESGLNADTVDSLEATALLKVGSGNNTTTISTNVSGTTNDYECATGTDCRYGSAGAGTMIFNAGSGRFDFADSTGTVRLAQFMGPGSYLAIWAMVDGSTAFMTTQEGFVSGFRTNAAVTQRVSGVGESLSSDGSSSDITAVFGGGLSGLEQPQTCNCGTSGTPNTVTCDIQSNVIHLTDGDADSCTVTLATTTIDSIVSTYGSTIVLPQITIIVDSVGGGGTFDLADQAGILEIAGAFAMGVKDNISLVYTSLTADEFQEIGRTDL